MEKIAYIEKIKEIIQNNQDDWIAMHDCHHVDLAHIIMQGELCVTYNPYGFNYERNFNNQIGWHINYAKSYNNNLYYFPKKGSVTLPEKPVCPIIVKIPKTLLNNADIKIADKNSYKIFCEYAFQEHDTIKNDEGEYISCRGPIRKTYKQASNVRTLPEYLIYGYIDVNTCELILNPYYYEFLSKNDQSKIEQRLDASILDQKQPN